MRVDRRVLQPQPRRRGDQGLDPEGEVGGTIGKAPTGCLNVRKMVGSAEGPVEIDPVPGRSWRGRSRRATDQGLDAAPTPRGSHEPGPRFHSGASDTVQAPRCRTSTGCCRPTWASSATEEISTRAARTARQPPSCGRRSRTCSPPTTPPANASASTRTTWGTCSAARAAAVSWSAMPEPPRHRLRVLHLPGPPAAHRLQQAIPSTTPKPPCAATYADIRLTPEQADQGDYVLDELLALGEASSTQTEVQTRRLRKLDNERRKLLEAHYAGAIPSGSPQDRTGPHHRSHHPAQARLECSKATSRPPGGQPPQGFVVVGTAKTATTSEVPTPSAASSARAFFLKRLPHRRRLQRHS